MACRTALLGEGRGGSARSPWCFGVGCEVFEGIGEQKENPSQGFGRDTERRRVARWVDEDAIASSAA